MSSPAKSSSPLDDSRLSSSNRTSSVLNPNAPKFVPSFMRSTIGSGKIADAARSDRVDSPVKGGPVRSDPLTSNNSKDEMQQFWSEQLPDDTLTNLSTSEIEEWESGKLPFSTLSMKDCIAPSPFRGPLNSPLDTKGNLTCQANVDSEYIDSFRSAPHNVHSNKWHEKYLNDQKIASGKEKYNNVGGYTTYAAGGTRSEYTATSDPVDSLAYLVLQFPGFSAKSISDLYYANCCNFNRTAELLTQLEMQAAAVTLQNSKATSYAPNFRSIDFPTLSTPEIHNGTSKGNRYIHGLLNGRNASDIGSGAADFASIVSKTTPHNPNQQKFETKGNAALNGSIGDVIPKQSSANRDYSCPNKLTGSGNICASPVWLETGEAVASMYSKLREEAQNLARCRNVCFDQARQAYLSGNNALAKELSAKGKFYDMQMKAAHEKAREAIFRLRNPTSGNLPGYNQKQDQLIDLHGLHVAEALHILKRELGTLRNAARFSGERKTVMVCVGTGHHTRSQTARLPLAVEKFLSEEGMRFAEAQPGLLRVVL